MELMAELGWETFSGYDELLGVEGNLGRETKGDVVLVPRLKAALEDLNPTLPEEAIQSAIDILARDRSAMSLAEANREVYKSLKEGIQVTFQDPEGGQKSDRVRVINWQDYTKNDFLVVNQLTVTGELYSRRPDLVCFVNGLPLVVVEFKKPGVTARQAFDDNLRTYKSDTPQLFWFNALLIASNGTESRVGSLTADWARFFEWKRIEREDEPRRVSLEVLLRGICEPSRFLDILENFILFSEQQTDLIKVLGQNHQVLGVNNAIQSTLEARQSGHGRGGVFWQTQGSGKSFSMVFYAQKILRKVPGNWTFVIITDRIELDDQIAKTFAACGAVTDAKACHASSGAHLKELLRGNNRYVFTLIHKFQSPEMLCDRKDVIVLTDEAHRSQYDTLAMNMRKALPNAIFLAFTGTPLIAGEEERTRQVFGDYVSIYDFQQSVEDGATVPLFYENRAPELHLENPDLNEDIYNLIEEAQLDEEAERRLERELGRQYHILTRDDRLETVAQDIVRHFLGRGFQGKAMVVSIDKATALRMYHKVRKYWDQEQDRVENQLAKGEGDQQQLQTALQRLKSVDMAVVISPSQNEMAQMKEFGVDVTPHRKRMNEEALDEKFKDPDDPLSLVFVCAMWLTGFDAPSCSTVYLDKPMRNHTLMQTIARANRVYPGKHSGLIVDYANVFASLEKALAIYGAGKGGANPVQDKQELVEELKKALEAASAFCRQHGVDIEAIETASPKNFDRLQKIGDAVNALISPDQVRQEFMGHDRLVSTLFKAIKPDPAVAEFASKVACINQIADAIRSQLGQGYSDISGVMKGLNELLDESIAADGFSIQEGNRTGPIDISKIDFEALSKRFKQSKKKNLELEKLKAAIQSQLNKLIRLNKTRVDYQDKLERLIESYNAGSRNIEELFEELLNLTKALTEEQQRHVRENLKEEELTVFDILTRPGPELSPEEREEVKKVAKMLLERLKDLLVINWRQKSSARSQVKLTIEDVLDKLPEDYDRRLFQQKCSAIFEHVYESYPDQGESVYAKVG